MKFPPEFVLVNSDPLFETAVGNDLDEIMPSSYYPTKKAAICQVKGSQDAPPRCNVNIGWNLASPFEEISRLEVGLGIVR